MFFLGHLFPEIYSQLSIIIFIGLFAINIYIFVCEVTLIIKYISNIEYKQVAYFTIVDITEIGMLLEC